MKTLRLQTPFLVSVVILLISACSQNSKNTFDLTAARKGIDEGNKAIMEFIMKSDSVGVSNMYTADAKIMAPGGPAVPKEQIRSFIHTLSVMGIKDFRLKTVDIWGNQDLIGEEGTWSVHDDKGTELDHGKYIVLWKQENNQWKLFRDCWNSDVPPAK